MRKISNDSGMLEHGPENLEPSENAGIGPFYSRLMIDAFDFKSRLGDPDCFILQTCLYCSLRPRRKISFFDISERISCSLEKLPWDSTS